MRRATHLSRWAVWGLALACMTTAQASDPEQPAVQAGQPAPAFALPDQSGATHRLADHRGQWVLVYV